MPSQRKNLFVFIVELITSMSTQRNVIMLFDSFKISPILVNKFILHTLSIIQYHVTNKRRGSLRKISDEMKFLLSTNKKMKFCTRTIPMLFCWFIL